MNVLQAFPKVYWSVQHQAIAGNVSGGTQIKSKHKCYSWWKVSKGLQSFISHPEAVQQKKRQEKSPPPQKKQVGS